MRSLHLIAVFLFAAIAAMPAVAQEERHAFVTSDVDVYDAPFGQGNILGIVYAGSRVDTWPDDCVDGWCPIVGETVPRGFAWVWAEAIAPGSEAVEPAATRASYSGTWETTTTGGSKYTLELKEADGNVGGLYSPQNGSMAGTIDDHGRLIYKWQQDGNFSGSGVFRLSEDGQRIEGTFSTTTNPFEISGHWNGVRTGVP